MYSSHPSFPLILSHDIFQEKITYNRLVSSRPSIIATAAARANFEHHCALVNHLSIYPSDVIPAVIAYCTCSRVSDDLATTAELFISTVEGPLPIQALNLHAYHFHDPSFRWAPTEARVKIFAWAQDLFAAHLVAYTLPFADLPDDCVGDVWEYMIEIVTARIELQHVIRCCSSPETLAWIRAVVAAAYAAVSQIVY